MMAHLSLWFIKNAFPVLFLNCIFISVLQFFKANHNSKALYKKVKATEREKTDILKCRKKEKACRIILEGLLKCNMRPSLNTQPEMYPLASPNHPTLIVGSALISFLLCIILSPILEAPKDKDLSASPMYSQWQKWHLAKIRCIIHICHVNDCIKHLKFFPIVLDPSRRYDSNSC